MKVEQFNLIKYALKKRKYTLEINEICNILKYTLNTLLFLYSLSREMELVDDCFLHCGSKSEKKNISKFSNNNTSAILYFTI